MSIASLYQQTHQFTLLKTNHYWSLELLDCDFDLLIYFFRTDNINFLYRLAAFIHLEDTKLNYTHKSLAGPILVDCLHSASLHFFFFCCCVNTRISIVYHVLYISLQVDVSPIIIATFIFFAILSVVIT